jgi:hypothetical protein
MTAMAIVMLVLFTVVLSGPGTQVSEISATARYSLSGPALGNHILNIIRTGPKPKVNGVDAEGVIAPMQYMQPLRDRSDEDFICNATCYEIPACPCTGRNEAVAILVAGSGPQNAAGWGLRADGAEETINERSDTALFVTGARAELCPAIFDHGRVGEELITAGNADASDFPRLTFRHDRLCDRWLCSERVCGSRPHARSFIVYGGKR